MTYEEIVKEVKKAYALADATAVTEHVAIQFNVYGEGEGAFYLEVAEGKVDIQPFEYYDRDAIVTLSSNTLMDIITGKTDVATAYNKGILNVDGNLTKATLLQQITYKKEEPKKEPAKKAEKPAAKKPCAKKACATKAAETKAPAKKAPAKKTTTKK